MNNTTLEKLHLCLLDLAKELKRICEDNNIKYFLVGGTLIGAIRHHGFIPWDDDLDIGMLREDYEKFLKVAPFFLDKKYKLQTWDNDLGYGLPFAKLIINDTLCIEYNSRNAKKDFGIFIDIFPYDNIPNNLNARNRQAILAGFYKRMLRAKLGYNSESKKILKKAAYEIFRIFSIFFQSSWLKKKYYKLMLSYHNISTEFLVAYGGAKGYKKEIIKKNFLEQTIQIPFEDTTFSVPKNYDLYLRTLYGDYMQLPPVNERENRHSYEKIDFGNYLKYRRE